MIIFEPETGKNFYTDIYRGYQYFIIKQGGKYTVLIDIKITSFYTTDDFRFLSCPFRMGQINYGFRAGSPFFLCSFSSIGCTFENDKNGLPLHLYGVKTQDEIFNLLQGEMLTCIDELDYFETLCPCERFSACEHLFFLIGFDFYLTKENKRFAINNECNSVRISHCPLCGRKLE